MVTKDEIISQLKQVIDPELGINVFDLGFIYGVDIKGSKVHIKMTLSSPHCPMSHFLVELVKQKVHELKETEAEVELVFDPPWNPAMLSQDAKKQLGM